MAMFTRDDVTADRIAGLEALYGDDRNFPTRDDEGDGNLFPDGSRFSTCTSWARYVMRIEGDGVHLYGFFDDDNPGSEIANLCGGHDFAVVDGRFIVDPWVKHVEGLSGRCVFDLDDPSDAEAITRLYGDRCRWKRGTELEADVRGETPEMRAAAMEGIGSADPEPGASRPVF